MEPGKERIDDCINNLEKALCYLEKQTVAAEGAYSKSFEEAHEECGRLLKRRLREYFASNRQADRLHFRDIFRVAANHCLISLDEAERWLQYRNYRNSDENDECYIENIKAALPQFVEDVKAIAQVVRDEVGIQREDKESRHYGLAVEPRYLEKIKLLLQEHIPNLEVWAFGSRVNGRSHEGSDLDLVLRSPGLDEIPREQLSCVYRAFRKSDIPFLVEIYDWTQLPESFHREIEQGHVVLLRPAPHSPAT